MTCKWNVLKARAVIGHIWMEILPQFVIMSKYITYMKAYGREENGKLTCEFYH